MFQRPIVGTIICFVALRLALAIETDATTLPTPVAACGSQCLFNYLVNGSTLVLDIMNNPPDKWLLQVQNLSTYFNTITNCVKIANFDQFLMNLMSEGIAFQDVLCELDLLVVAECISKHLFLNCPVFDKSEQCQAVKAFLNSNCLYSQLFT
ncbi:uncharacterized protein LOC135699564 [Ochlerotatus camptorhynchus]|uniref:uncharacterized protein LOC135699564 n=1 Tax=Ochlerotatus camptorhynchus TaxID=644619 RepID=UPI0031D61C8C